MTRDGHRIGELLPLRGRRRFVGRAEFAALSGAAPDLDLTAFRRDQTTLDEASDDPYER